MTRLEVLEEVALLAEAARKAAKRYYSQRCNDNLLAAKEAEAQLDRALVRLRQGPELFDQ